MSDWWLAFQNGMQEYFNIPPSQTIPALIGMVMIFGIFFLVLYEAFRRVTDNESAAGGISILVSIAAVLYMAYAGWILALMSFGVAVLIIVGVIFFFGILLVGWHRTAARVHEASKEKWEAKKNLIEARGSANEAAREKIKDFFKDIKTMSTDYYDALKEFNKITKENAMKVDNGLGNMQTTLQKMRSITLRWIKYLKDQGYKEEVKEAKRLDRRITNSYNDIEEIRSKISKGDYKGASKLLFKLKKEEIKEIKDSAKDVVREEKEEKEEFKLSEEDITILNGIEKEIANFNKTVAYYPDQISKVTPKLNKAINNWNSKHPKEKIPRVVGNFNEMRNTLIEISKIIGGLKKKYS